MIEMRRLKDIVNFFQTVVSFVLSRKIVSKVSICKKEFKYLIGYKYAKKIRPLCTFLPKMTAYRKDFDEIKFLSLLIIDHELLQKYNDIWEKIKDSLKREFDSKPVYNKKQYPKLKFYNGKINTNFENNKIPKADSEYICLSIILLNSVFKTVKNYYPQMFLEECKYVVNKKKIPKYIIDDTEISSDSDGKSSEEED